MKTELIIQLLKQKNPGKYARYVMALVHARFVNIPQEVAGATRVAKNNDRTRQNMSNSRSGGRNVAVFETSG